MLSPRSRLLAAALAVALAAQPACQMSRNHRQGLTMLGGAAVFTGGIIALDGLYCDAGNDADATDCAEDDGDLASGAALLTAGAIVMAFALLSKVKPEGPK